jgi:hypothetical protein
MLTCFKAIKGIDLEESDREIVNCNEKTRRWEASFQNFPIGEYNLDTDAGRFGLVDACRKIQPKGTKRTRVTIPTEEQFMRWWEYPCCYFFIP